MSVKHTFTNIIQIIFPIQEDGRFFLWIPVLLGIGVALYFSLSFEPGLLLVSGLLGLLSSLLLVGTYFHANRYVLYICTLCGCVTLGFLSSVVRTRCIQGPLLKEEIVTLLEGKVIDCIQLINFDKRIILELDPKSFKNYPRRIQLRVKQKNVACKIGSTVSFLGKIFPLPQPVEPFAFDYARSLYFQKIGALGYALTRPEIVQDVPDTFLSKLSRARFIITQKIYAALPGEGGAMAAALITGEKTALDTKIVTALQTSGIAHILAISGLHMALFCGVVFWVSRLFCAFIPYIALNYPIKKICAFLAMLAGFFYLSISGYGVATQRSFIMICFVFLSIIGDKSIISLRNVAIAAIFLLILEPETLLSASFQMSFSAVIGLVSLYESRISTLILPTYQKLTRIRAVSYYISSLLLASFVATLFTAPFSAFHFHRLTAYGVITNMVAIPLMGFLVMPAALLALLLMPIGLEAWPLKIMEGGMFLIRFFASFVSSWPGSLIYIKQGSTLALVLITLGGLWMVLWKNRRRRPWGFIAIILGITLWTIDPRPDFLVERNGKVIGVLHEGKRILSGTHPAYVTKSWLLSDGDRSIAKDIVQSSLYVELPLSWEALKVGGTHAIWLKKNKIIRIKSVQDVRGERPWV